jgi:hypothetical protein
MNSCCNAWLKAIVKKGSASVITIGFNFLIKWFSLALIMDFLNSTAAGTSRRNKVILVQPRNDRYPTTLLIKIR